MNASCFDVLRRATGVLVMASILLAASALSAAQPTTQPAAYINQAMDKPVQLELDAQLPDALARITQRTGVPIQVDSEVWTLLPWGRLTRMKATLDHQTLRQALDAITGRLALTYRLQPDQIEILPSPALKRLGRRATPQELALLLFLSDTPLNQNGAIPAQTLLAHLDQQLAKTNPQYAIENRMGDPAANNPTLHIARNASCADALNELPRQSDFTWYPWGRHVVVLSKADWIRMQLAKPITIRFNDQDIQQVLNELAARAGVSFNIEPGAIQRIAPEYRNIRLMLENATIHQALASISGYTGLGFVIKNDGLYFWNQSPPQNTHTGHFVGLLRLPDLDIGVPIRDTDISPALRQYIEKQTAEAIEKLERRAQAATRPSH